MVLKIMINQGINYFKDDTSFSIILSPDSLLYMWRRKRKYFP